MKHITLPPGVCNLHPEVFALALYRASDIFDHAERIRRIDEITDALVDIGRCRPRHDTSRMGEWIAMRPKDPTWLR